MALDIISSTQYGSDMKKRRTKKKKVSDQLRQVIDDSGLTRYRICKEIGLDESTMAKFYNGQQGLSSKALDRLGEFLDLTIVMGKPTEKKGR